MMLKRIVELGSVLSILGSMAFAEVAPPAPVNPVPTKRQLAWHELEYYGFFHFTQNTFTDKEWGYGDESVETFNPTDPDPRQWVEIAKEVGMKAVIPTCKHHDGFCLWPSKYTEHSVKNAPCKIDFVGEVAKACHELGLKFGIYLSPWDRNHAHYGGPEYIELGQRILRFSVEAHNGGQWTTIAEGTSIGWKRILVTDPVTADKVRFNVLESKACPTLSTLSLYAGPGS